jgi:hypothetical protein
MEERCGTWWAALGVGLAITLAAPAKEPVRPKVSGEPAKNSSHEEKILSGTDANRLLEILVELAWLADPVTFPYFLEARVEGPALHLRGFVPSISVRDQALKLARLHCPMSAQDDMKIRPGISVRPVRLPADQMEKAARTSLGVFFPRTDGHFQIRADNAGHVQVRGFVNSFEEKLALSQELRRLHGSTAVINLVHVDSPCQTPTSLCSIPKPDMEAALAMMMTEKPKPLPPVANIPQPTKPAKSLLEKVGLVGRHTGPALPVAVADFQSKLPESKPGPVPEPKLPKEQAEMPPVQDVILASAIEESSAPILVTHGTILLREEPEPENPAIQLRNHIAASCRIPEQNLRVQFKTARDVEIRIQAKDEVQANALAIHLFQLPELLPYRVDVQATIPR